MQLLDKLSSYVGTEDFLLKLEEALKAQQSDPVEGSSSAEEELSDAV